MDWQTVRNVVIGVAVGVVLGIGGFTFIYARGYSYLTNDPAACANCHVMREQFDGWVKSSHRSVAGCNDCHTPHDFVGKYYTKARNGFWHSFYFTTFTDARARKEGLFEQAEGGTLFLDEIGELELGLQAKLLRVLEEGAFRRVGGLKDIPLDVRIVAASNRDLRAESEAGRFRLDLYYRLSVIQIDIPPLRERGDDILLLAGHYIGQFGERLKLRRKIRGLAPEVAEAFRRYAWPGNVRELRNVIERALILEDSDTITAEYLPRDLAAVAGHAPAASAAGVFGLPPGGLSLEELETSLVRQAVARSGGNQTRAAELLGISRDQLRYRLKKMGAGDAEGADAAARAAEG